MKRRWTHTLQGLLGAVFLGSCVSASAAVTNTDPIEINLAAGSLSQALQALSRATHLQLLYDPELTGRYSTSGVQGMMTAAGALEALLAPTDIGARFTAPNTVALYRKLRTPATPVPPPPAAAQTYVPQVQTVTVTTHRGDEERYEPLFASSAMKLDEPALIAPIAAQSVTHQVLNDQQAGHLEDVLEQISSVESAPAGQSSLGFNIRGFTTYQYYLDGVRISPDLHHDGFRDLANVERIEIVKGPASTLYGRTEPGGLVNILRKQPTSDPLLSVQQQAGAFGRWRTQFDAGGPLSSPASMLYRFNAAYESGGSFREGLRNRRLLLSPTVSWTPSPDTRTTAYLEYLRSDDPTDYGLPIIANAPPPVPVRQRVEDGGETHARSLQIGVEGSHTLNDRWTLHYHLDGRWLRSPQSPQLVLSEQGLFPGNCTPSRCLLDRDLFALPVSHGQTYFGSTNLVGSVTLWGLKHSLLIGAEHFDVRGHDVLRYSSAPNEPIDLFNPVHAPVPDSLLQNPEDAGEIMTVEQWKGIYLQDQVAIRQTLHLFVGARYDHVWESLDTAFGLPTADSARHSRWDNAFKRRAGILWHPTTEFSFYATYLENFGIATGLYGQDAGDLLPPESAREWELGVKAQLLDGALSASAAWYNLTEVNIPQPAISPLLNARGFRKLTGAARSRGLELDLQGQILPNLQVIASYAYIDSKITADTASELDANGNFVLTAGNTGKRLYGVPRHGASAWLAYQPASIPLHGLKLGIGVTARSVREGNNANDYQLAGFARWKALVAYGWRTADTRFSVQLNVDNVGDSRYFESISGNPLVMPGAPRTWLVSLRAER